MMIAVRHRLMRHLPPPDAEEFATLLRRLSPAASSQLAAAKNDNERLAIVQNWTQTSWQTRYRYARITGEQLQNFFPMN